MTKLLQGKSLFIAKHMHNQLRGRVDPQPPTPIPEQYRHPCLSTRLYDGQPVDHGAMGLVETGSTHTWLHAEKIGEGSFIFHLPADTFAESFLVLYGIHTYLGNPLAFTTLQQLASQHWVRLYPRMAFQTGRYNPSQTYDLIVITPGDPHVEISGMEYGATMKQPPGEYMMTGTWTFDKDGNDWWALGDYYCPIDGWMNWQFQRFYGGATHSERWRVTRSHEGEYTVLPPGVY